jgi:RNA polymerase sigma-70 factor (ECF subfamily)
LLYARQWAPSQHDAEDLLQEAFLRFWKNRERADDPLAYLYSCVRTAGLDSARSRTTRHRHEAQAHRERPTEIWFRSSADGSSLQDQLEPALRRLPDEQRETVILKIWGELTFDQIGRTMETSPHTAASRYRAALQSLKRRLLEDQVP